MKCPNCDGKGKTTEYDGLRKFWCDYKCEQCHGSGEVEQTNEEWFDTLTTKGKAEVIAQLSSYGGNVEAILEWLKQPHTNE